MARTARLDRKTLKEDALTNFVGRSWDYVGRQRNTFIGIAAAAGAAIVLLVFWGRGRSEKASEAGVRATSAVSALVAGEYQAALSLADGLKSAYGGSSGAVIGEYVRGQAQLRLGDFTAAEQGFRDYLSSASKAPIYEIAAKQGLAASLESQKRFAEAATLYEEAAAALTEPVASQARLDAARAHQAAGALDRAKALLKEVSALDNLHARQAQIELAVLEGTSAAPVTTPTP